MPNTERKKTNSVYSGVIPAMITPCRKTGQPDREMTENLARNLIAHGCHGLFTLGSSGELPLLDEAQRRMVTRAARKGAGTAAKVYTGASGFGIKETIRNIYNAEEDGADAAVIMAPFFLKVSQPGLYEYTKQIADASPIPLAIYNHFRMPSIFETETLKKLAEHPKIIGLKDTDSNLDSTIEKLQGTIDLPISFFQGREPFLYDSFLAGAEGCVSALANIAPEAHRNLYDAVKTGHLEDARQHQKQIDSLSRLFKLNESQESMSGFLYTIRKVTVLRGWIESTSDLIPGFTATEQLDNKIIKIVQESGLSI